MAANSKITAIPLGNKPYATAFYSLGSEICHNMYLEIAQSQFAKVPYYLIKQAGLQRFGSIPAINEGACRCMFTTSSLRTYCVNGSVVSEVLADGTKVFIGNLNTTTMPVSMAENGKLICIVDGAQGWILRLSDNNITQITDEYFPGTAPETLAPTHVTYIDSYFIVNNPQSDSYYWSSSFYSNTEGDNPVPYDPTVQVGYWTPLQTGKKIGKADNISALISCNNYLWLLGYNSCEVHQDTGNYNGQLFARYEGAILNIGCKAQYSVAVYSNNLFWLGSDIAGTLGVFTNNGMSPERISTRGIEQLIETFETWSDCQAFTYSQSGHNYYVMQFPKASRTLVYDMVTQAWHERTTLLASTGTLVRWSGMYCTNNYDLHITGDASTSALYQLNPKYPINDNPMDTGYNNIRCAKTTPIGFSDGQNVRYNSVQAICSQGTGLQLPINGVGDDPQLQIAWSDDCGVTWSNEMPAPIGKQGEYDKRTRVLACGMGRNRVWRLVMTDPVPFLLVGLLIDGAPCKF